MKRRAATLLPPSCLRLSGRRVAGSGRECVVGVRSASMSFAFARASVSTQTRLRRSARTCWVRPFLITGINAISNRYGNKALFTTFPPSKEDAEKRTAFRPFRLGMMRFQPARPDTPVHTGREREIGAMEGPSERNPRAHTARADDVPTPGARRGA